MAKKKTKNSMGKTILSLLAIVVSLLTCLPLFLNVWIWKASNSGGETLTDVGGYFEDMEGFEKLFNVGEDKLPVWGSTLAGVCVIIALVCAVMFTFLAIINMIGKSSKTLNKIQKLVCIIMIIAGIGALVGSIAFVVAEYKRILATYSMTMAFGAIAGFVFPILGGILGLASNK